MTAEEKLSTTLDAIAVGMGDIVNLLENPNNRSLAQAIADGVGQLQIRPQFNVAPSPVSVAPGEAPEVSVNVQPAQVMVMPADARGWKMTVTSRDSNGHIREMLFNPVEPGT